MKRSILISAITGALITISSVVFPQGSAKTEPATCKPIEFKTEKETIQFRQDSDEDYKSFVKEADKRILANRNKLSNLKTVNPIHRNANIDSFQSKLKELQLKNDFLKNKIEESFITKTCAWPDFKTEFSRDMNELEVSTKKLEEDRKKLKSRKKIAGN